VSIELIFVVISTFLKKKKKKKDKKGVSKKVHPKEVKENEKPLKIK
jgi:hypothetical protein